MGKNLGELGQPKVRDVDAFTWFGEKIRIGNVSDLLLIDFLNRAEQVDEHDVKAGLTLIRDAFSGMIHADDFDRFWQISIREKQDTTDLMTLMKALVEGVSGRPTKRRSGSSPGRRGAGKKSKRGSSSPGMAPVVRRLQKQGRPELALMVDERLRSIG